MILTTERLVLREFEESDWRAVLAYQRDPHYLRFTPWRTRTDADVHSFIRMFLNWRQEMPRQKFQLAIILSEQGCLIGNAGIRISPSASWEAEIGYELDHRYWGHGYATEAAQALLSFGFQDLRLHRVFAHCIAENTASARVMQRLGMQFDGCLRENEWMKDRWWDTFVYSILAQEWRARLYASR
jgi:RimJ/RimL family protein N-acetyltransferase